jgi:SWI/SNF-related matrix-associated actin-dependent regulator of chromatin subfamily A member 5
VCVFFCMDLMQSVDAPLLDQPIHIVGEMRDYQLRGFSFLVNCYRYGVNCVLADEMGLGKTIQTIAYLTYVTLGDQPKTTSSGGGVSGKKSKLNPAVKGDGGPSLVVVPLSVLTSWMQELKRFSPKLRVVRLHSGDEKERERLRKEVSERYFIHSSFIQTKTKSIINGVFSFVFVHRFSLTQPVLMWY